MTKWNGRAARRLLAFADDAPTVEEAIDRVVGRLVDGVQCPPTDLAALMRRLDVVSVDEDATLTGSGVLVSTADGRFKIRYSPQSESRSRFTIAHELAHVVFTRTGDPWPRRGRELERLCDMIASEILMPKRVFRLAAAPFPTLAVARSLSGRFRTSLTATVLRCAQLFDLSCFEIENGYWRWSYSIARQLSRYMIKDDIGSMIDSAIERPAGEADLCLRVNGQFKPMQLEWQALGGGGRHLFMLRPKTGSYPSRSCR